MLYYDRIDLSERIDVDKSNNSKECIVCHYWFFKHGFKFQSFICKGCHDIPIITVKSVDYPCIFYDASKSEAIHLLKNFVVDDRG